MRRSSYKWKNITVFHTPKHKQRRKFLMTLIDYFRDFSMPIERLWLSSKQKNNSSFEEESEPDESGLQNLEDFNKVEEKRQDVGQDRSQSTIEPVQHVNVETVELPTEEKETENHFKSLEFYLLVNKEELWKFSIKFSKYLVSEQNEKHHFLHEIYWVIKEMFFLNIVFHNPTQPPPHSLNNSRKQSTRRHYNSFS